MTKIPFDDAKRDYPNYADASNEAKTNGTGVIYFQECYFNLVWFEGSVRRARFLKRWQVGA